MDYVLKGQELFKKIILRIKLLFIPFKSNNFRPKFLQSNVLLYIVFCLLIIKVISIVVFVNFPKNIFFADVKKTDLIKLINKERLSLGVSLLKENQKLDEAALLKAKDILEKDYFSHKSPEGITPWYWFAKTGYNYKYAGENLAIGFLNSEDVYSAWINSMSHKENIINPNYQEIGTAVLTGEYKGNNTTVAVQLFGSPKIINVLSTKEIPEKTLKLEEQPVNKDIIEKDIINISVQSEVLSQTAETSLKEKDITYYNFLNFLFYNSYNINVFEYIVYLLLILMVVSLLLNILINFNIQDRYLILRSLVIIILLSVTALLNKEAINQIIVHKVII